MNRHNNFVRPLISFLVNCYLSDILSNQAFIQSFIYKMTYKLSKKSNERNIRHSSIIANDSSNQVLIVGKRIRFSNEEKFEIWHRYFEGSKISQNDLCLRVKDKFLLDQVPAQASISGILKGYDVLEFLTTNELQAFNLRKAQYPELENKIVAFIYY
jgi:hypothetical protein